MKENLFEFGERLKKLGFSPTWYNSVCGGLESIDWINDDKECITTCVCYTKEYDKYIMSLAPETEYEPDWRQCCITDIVVRTPEFAYPEGHWRDGHWYGDIRLSEYSYLKNFSSLSIENFEKALWMARNPIQAKTQIVRKFLDETDTFFKIHGDTLKELGYKEKESLLLPVGCELIETEPYISFKRKDQYRELVICYNMWTEKLTYTKYVPSEGNYGTNYEVNVNDTSKEEFKEHLESLFE